MKDLLTHTSAPSPTINEPIITTSSDTLKVGISTFLFSHCDQNPPNSNPNPSKKKKIKHTSYSPPPFQTPQHAPPGPGHPNQA